MFSQFTANFFKCLDQTVNDARQNGYVITPLGRLLTVSNGTDPKSVSNFSIQGTASDGFKLALIALDERLKGLDAGIVHLLHDEIIVEANAEITEAVSEIVKECMESASEEIFRILPFRAKPVILDSWGSKGEESC